MFEAEIVDFDQELIDRLTELTGKQCVLTGSEDFEIAHIEHRGMGGDKSKNRLDNIVPLRKDFHDLMDGRKKKVKGNGYDWSEISIERWNPEQGILEIMAKSDLTNWQYKKVPHEYIYYHQRAGSIEAYAEAHEHHENVVAARKGMGQAMLVLGKNLYKIREDNEYELLDYDSFQAYLASPEVSIKRRHAYRFIRVYKTFREHLETDTKRLSDIGVTKLDMISSEVSEENKDEMLDKAKGLSVSDLRKEMSDGGERISCKKCAKVASISRDIFRPYAQGERKMHYCAMEEHKYIIETLSKAEAEELACEKFGTD